MPSYSFSQLTNICCWLKDFVPTIRPELGMQGTNREASSLPSQSFQSSSMSGQVIIMMIIANVYWCALGIILSHLSVSLYLTMFLLYLLLHNK